MNDPAQSIMELLEQYGSLVTFWVGLGEFPQTPEEVVLINGTGGRSPYPHLAINFPSVQVMVRGKKSGYVTARAQMATICDVLLGISSTVLNGDTYRSCNQIGDVISLGQDDNGRPIFSANFSCIVLPSSLGNRRTIE